ncbi:MAG: hypothetical protein OEV37_00690 [Candidatus Berkelbacteria bacterium]|nr:hypothetical protein [Candidatus Berkelbacteria bacterium]
MDDKHWTDQFGAAIDSLGLSVEEADTIISKQWWMRLQRPHKEHLLQLAAREVRGEIRPELPTGLKSLLEEPEEQRAKAIECAMRIFKELVAATAVCILAREAGGTTPPN